MDFSDNPYRVLALPANATQRQVVARIDELKTAARIGVSLTHLRDPSWAGTVERTEHRIERARQRLECDDCRAADMFHWYWAVPPAHPCILDFLLDGRFVDAARVCHAVLQAALPVEQHIALQADLSLALRLALETETCRHLRLFERLHHLVTCHIDLYQTLDTHRDIRLYDGDPETLLDALPSTLHESIRPLRGLNIEATSDTEARQAQQIHARCVTLLRSRTPFASLIVELPAPHAATPVRVVVPSAVSHEIAADLSELLKRFLKGLLRGIWCFVRGCAHAVAQFTVCVAIACSPALLLFGVSSLLEWAFVRPSSRPVDTRTVAAVAAPAPHTPRPALPVCRTSEREYEDRIDDLTAQLADLEDALGEREYDELALDDGELDPGDLFEEDDPLELFDDEEEEW